jgi:hypothetical protein
MQSVHSFRPVLVGVLASIALARGTRAAASEPQPTTAWMTDYHAALDEAETCGRQAVIWFYDASAAANNERFESGVLQEPAVVELLASRFVCAKLPSDIVVSCAGEQQALLKHPAFSDLRGSPGLAVIDMAKLGSPLHRQVVSIYPFTHSPISAEKLNVLLTLPRGTLTQRTLIFAVRTHPEAPASTSGELSSILARETERHANHQATITLQGHHNWESRFHAINAQLPGGLLAREVCAESWPGQNLLDAAVECVHSWRQSSGHWNAVSASHPLFAYDMKRGSNGVWYAAGIFAGK